MKPLAGAQRPAAIAALANSERKLLEATQRSPAVRDLIARLRAHISDHH